MEVMLVKLTNVATDSLGPRLKLDYTVIDTDTAQVIDKDHVLLEQYSTISARKSLDEAFDKLVSLVEQEVKPDQVVFDFFHKVDLTVDLSTSWTNYQKSKKLQTV